MWEGDLWCACTVTIDRAARWGDLVHTWADPRVSWAGTAPMTFSPSGGRIIRDWVGPSARTTGEIIVPLTHPGVDDIRRGQWATIRGHACPLAQAPPDGDPTGVPHVAIAELLITSVRASRADGMLTLAVEDTCTVVGSLPVDTGSGPVGLLPKGRTVKTVIAEVVGLLTLPRVSIFDHAAPDAPWAPAVLDGALQPLTGTVWDVLEQLATLAGIYLTTERAQLHLWPAREITDRTPVTLTEMPGPGVLMTQTTVEAAPTMTRAIVTGQDDAGNQLAGRARSALGEAEQGYRLDDITSISGATTQAALTAAAASRMVWLEANHLAGDVETTWLPFLEPGDVVGVNWATGGRSHYVQAVELDLDPLRPMRLSLRGGAWRTWAHWRATWTWATLRQGTWRDRLRS